MRFEPNEDQATFLSALDQMSGSDAAAWRTSPDWDRFQWSPALDDLLESSGFLDCAAEETLGPVAAAAMIHRVARLPVLAECAATAMLRPMLGVDLPRPIAVIDDRPDGAIRFLPVARTVVSLAGETVSCAILDRDAVLGVESLFAYPMGRLATGALDWRILDVDAERVRDAWRTALCAELGGVLKGGLDAVVSHVQNRHQFGRPLGSFQAIQHRLAASAGNIEAGYWLALRAAHTRDALDAATAMGYVQNAATRVTNDLHQFMGAMGLTLEHPLHRWTYRARLLRSAMGGASGNLERVADRRWRAA